MPNFRAPYAQTILQFFNQLAQADYDERAVEEVRVGWHLARRVFTSRLHSSGKVFYAHVIGSASVLVSINERPALVVAALLHNLYGNGLFPEGGRSTGAFRRWLVKKMVGEEVEDLLFRFWSVRWDRDHLAEWLLLDELKPWQKDLLTLRLADAIDHALMLGLDHEGAAPNRKRFERDRSLMVELAKKHGLDGLATIWLEQMADYQANGIPPEVAAESAALPTVILPASYMGGVRQKIRSLLRRFRRGKKKV